MAIPGAKATRENNRDPLINAARNAGVSDTAIDSDGEPAHSPEIVGGTTASPGQEGCIPMKNPLVSIIRATPKWLRWIAGILCGFLLLLVVGSFFVDEPLRRSMENNMNSHLKGYSVRLPGLHFSLMGFSVTLKGLKVAQQAFPEPPVAEFPYLKASVHWQQLLFGKLVAQFELDRPAIHVNLQQLRAEVDSATPVAERGWQQAVEDIFPLKINLLKITGGDVVYIDQDPDRPLHLSDINLRAENIRNIRMPDQVYPSSFRLTMDIFGTGHGVFEGKTNFLAVPFPGMKADFTMEKVPLDYFKPVFARANLLIHRGDFFASGGVEYAPKVKTAHVKDLTINNLEIDYIHTTATDAAEKNRATEVKNAAGKVSNEPGLLLLLDHLNVSGSTIGMINKSVKPNYRVFLAETDVHLTNLSNQFAEGPAEAKLRGKFMGSGMTTAVAHFRPEQKGPDFDINVDIKDTKLVALNDMLRAYGNFDVAAGLFSFYSELHIKNDAISGYVKPLFRGMKVYDRRKDKEKNEFRKMYEMLVGGLAQLLENSPRGEIATKADITGSLQSPKTDTFEIIGRLIKNAFFKAILPGFEQEVTKKKR